MEESTGISKTWTGPLLSLTRGPSRSNLPCDTEHWLTPAREHLADAKSAGDLSAGVGLSKDILPLAIRKGEVAHVPQTEDIALSIAYVGRKASRGNMC